MSKLTAVIVGRNDNYGGDLVKRAAFCFEQLLAYTVDEIIYVDWNTINGVSLLDKVKSSCIGIISCDKIKEYRVTPDIIAQYLPHCKDISIVETVARNVGIQRASEDSWVLSTNVDILLDQNIKHILPYLSKRCMYTARRRDVPKDYYLKYDNGIDLFHDLHAVYNKFPAKPHADQHCDSGDIWSLAVCCGDFQLAHKSHWNNIRGFEEEMVGRCYADTNLMKKSYMVGEINCLEIDNFFHLNHDNSKITLPGEYLPINDRLKYTVNFQKSTNPVTWGMSDINL